MRRDDLRQAKVLEERLEPADGEALVRVGSFAFTTNNVTYAVVADVLRYWEFWPAPQGWGRVPAWGFGEVVASRHPEAKAGDRLYGFWPMSTHAVLRVGKVAGQSLIEGSAHRRGLPIAYNLYRRVASKSPEEEALEALFLPLFGTSFLLDDFLGESGFFGARRVIVLSASGKTALALAHELRRRGGVEVLGLTSARNEAFVRGLGLYDRVATYDAIGSLEKDPSVYVDFAGDSAVRERLHGHLGGALKYACAVGMSHGEARPKGEGLPGPKPVFFFAPEHGRKRAEAWGGDGYARRQEQAWQAFRPAAAKAITVVRGSGDTAVARVYAEALEGRVAPDRGHILSLHA